MQPSPYADRLQYGAPLPVKDKATYKLSDPSLLPHIPAFTILPAHAININLRALAQSSRYIVTQSVAQETKDILRGDSQRVEDVSVVQARDGFESRITPEEQNLDAAEILVEVAKGQQPTSVATDAGTISVAPFGESDVGFSMEYSQTCPVPTCEYHHKRFSLKAERDKHTMTHVEGDMICDYYTCPFRSFDWSNDRISNLRVDNVKHVKNHVYIFHDGPHNPIKVLECQVCFRELSRPDYLDHLDGCIVRTVEFEASGRARACPVSSCDHHVVEFPSRYLRGQHLFQCHFEILKRCGKMVDCYWCPRENKLNAVDEFKSHLSEKHDSDLRIGICPLCLRTLISGKELLEHYDTCIILRMERIARIWTSL